MEATPDCPCLLVVLTLVPVLSLFVSRTLIVSPAKLFSPVLVVVLTSPDLSVRADCLSTPDFTVLVDLISLPTYDSGKSLDALPIAERVPDVPAKVLCLYE